MSKTYKFSDLFVTKSLIEENLSSEEIFEFYLYPVDFTSRYLNPYRLDNNPGARYYVSKSEILYFIDPGWDNKHYNCYSVVMSHYNCNFQEALKHIWEDMIEGKELQDRGKELEEIKRNRKESAPIDLKVKVKPYTKKELEFWNIGGIKVTEEELTSKGIWSIQTLWENHLIHDNLTFHFAYVRDGIVNQVYMPLKPKESRRFINRTGFKFNFPTIKNDNKILVLSKSGKDQFFIEKFGISAAYNVNETVVISKELFGKLREEFDIIVSLFDPDRQGFRAAWRHRKEYGIQPIFVSKEVRNSLLVKSKPKDFTEFLQQFGYQSVIDEIEHLKSLI